VSGNEQLSDVARRAIENPKNTVYVSAASVWEIAIKRQIGKLPDSVQFSPSLVGYLRHRGFTELAMTVEHAEAAGELTAHHRDPFDRMLIAQARVNTMKLVSNETLFDKYEVSRIW
jgi:PIN domain nuclease of toxin-antitoxin system